MSGASSFVYRTLFISVLFGTVMQPEVCSYPAIRLFLASVELVILDLW